MSRTDFERCTPAEFYQTYEKWNERRKAEERSQWEQTRVIAMYLVQPYSKKRVTAKDVLPLPWDDEQQSHQQQPPREQLTEEEITRRYAEARRRYGMQ